MIFALVIPRKWHLDLSPVNFDFRHGLLHGLFKAFFSLVAIGIVASMDMILWIAVIIALAGPMILSGIEEVYIDVVSVPALESSHRVRHHQLTAEERLSILVAILCGNFEGDPQMVSHLQTDLSTIAPATPNAPTLGTIKVRLEEHSRKPWRCCRDPESFLPCWIALKCQRDRIRNSIGHQLDAIRAVAGYDDICRHRFSRFTHGQQPQRGDNACQEQLSSTGPFLVQSSRESL